VTDEDAMLVLAGAGSGKTSVITAKAAYPLERGIRTPEEILLMALGKDAANFGEAETAVMGADNYDPCFLQSQAAQPLSEQGKNKSPGRAALNLHDPVVHPFNWGRDCR